MKRKRAQPDLPTCAAAMGPAARGAVPVPWPSRVGDTTSMAHCRAHRAPAPLAPWRQMRHNSVVLSTEPAGGGPAPGVRWTVGHFLVLLPAHVGVDVRGCADLGVTGPERHRRERCSQYQRL